MEKISLVVPVFNEEEVINIFYDRVKAELSQYHVQIVFPLCQDSCRLSFS